VIHIAGAQFTEQLAEVEDGVVLWPGKFVRRLPFERSVPPLKRVTLYIVYCAPMYLSDRSFFTITRQPRTGCNLPGRLFSGGSSHSLCYTAVPGP
jgi:hypothetical protein